ncbi:hypothetical protein AALO_G00188840 [Alosa alosa]|uniref:Uncharacterized protein n=1 Tax=Alosa alosa TaxID=278164 RepID=A0AAV6G9D9_9TELE|nr:hypothetical protein AALO_G00188840 [Alosa alosa]
MRDLLWMRMSSVLDDVSASNKEVESDQTKSAVGEVAEQCTAPTSDPRDEPASSHPIGQKTERSDCPSSSESSPRHAAWA